MSQEKKDHGNHGKCLDLIINGKKYAWDNEYITGSEIKELGNIDKDADIFLSIKEPWDDEEIKDDTKVNLARPEIEEFYCKLKLDFTVEGKKYQWYKQFITGSEIKKLAGLPNDAELLLAITRPWEDEVIKNETSVDLARPGIEHFFVRKSGCGLVHIHINRKKYDIERGKYTVEQLKKIGNVPIADELEQLIDGKLTPLADDATVLIKGCEEFFSHVRDGSSS